VLLIAYHFPPDNAIGAARPYRFYKYLPSFGQDCFVISAADVSRTPETNGIYVPDPWIDNPKRNLGWHFERFVRRFILPGASGVRWSVHAYRAAARFIAENRDRKITVLSTYPPMGAPFAAYLIARKYKLPWIADYRDPLGVFAPSVRLNKFHRAIADFLERHFARTADRSIANTDVAGERLTRLVPAHASRIEVIWNGFDPDRRLHALPIPNRSFKVLSHVGTLYQDRAITDLLLSIQRLIADGRLDPSSIRIHQVGDAAPTCLPDEDFVRAAEQNGWLQLTTRTLPQKEAQQIMCSSDGLILLQPHTAIQVPAKLYEYLQVGRPILAHVTRHSVIERVLSRSGVPYTCVYPDQSPAEFDAAVSNFLEGDFTTVRPSNYFEQNFNGQHQAETLARIIGSVPT
jgi:glycosyltransferase involved in cell wall biosynthesis